LFTSGALFTHRASVTPTNDLPIYRGDLAYQEKLIEQLALHRVVAKVEVLANFLEYCVDNLLLDIVRVRSVGMFVRTPPYWTPSSTARYT
jgi:hypothetical protein